LAALVAAWSEVTQRLQVEVPKLPAVFEITIQPRPQEFSLRVGLQPRLIKVVAAAAVGMAAAGVQLTVVVAAGQATSRFFRVDLRPQDLEPVLDFAHL
jgi:hypothetical protein